MGLSAEDAEKVAHHLALHELACWLCEGELEPLGVSPVPDVATETVELYVTVRCTNCAHVMFFGAPIVLGRDAAAKYAK